jgi:hypothetical protein
MIETEGYDIQGQSIVWLQELNFLQGCSRQKAWSAGAQSGDYALFYHVTEYLLPYNPCHIYVPDSMLERHMILMFLYPKDHEPYAP